MSKHPTLRAKVILLAKPIDAYKLDQFSDLRQIAKKKKDDLISILYFK
jgi:hypothetical protein